MPAVLTAPEVPPDEDGSPAAPASALGAPPLATSELLSLHPAKMERAKLATAKGMTTKRLSEDILKALNSDYPNLDTQLLTVKPQQCGWYNPKIARHVSENCLDRVFGRFGIAFDSIV
jgi:hypothetical protein